MEDITLIKSKQFALRIIKLYKYLKDRNEFDLSSQILRSGTSIGANLTEASYAISKKEFYFKTSISLKECAETKFWLELLYESGYLDGELYTSLINDCIELLKLLTSITKTLKDRLK